MFAHRARELRYSAGNAVAWGLPHDAAVAAITINPARVFGVADRIGSLAVGRAADLILWSGDPLDVANTASQLWLDGRAIPMVSRQTELRDRYLHRDASALPPAYSH